MIVDCQGYIEGKCNGGNSSNGCDNCCVGCKKMIDGECSTVCMGALNESIKCCN